MSELTTQNQAEEQAPARTVVVAEDEALIRLDIVEILKDQGFDVVAETDNGKTAVELAQKHRPDLVLMDVKIDVYKRQILGLSCRIFYLLPVYRPDT